jgi:competence protein ComEA
MPWRVLEDTPDRTMHEDDRAPGAGADAQGDAGARRRPRPAVLAAIGIAVAAAMSVAAVLLIGGVGASTLVLPDVAAQALGEGPAPEGGRPGGDLAASGAAATEGTATGGPVLIVDVAGAVRNPGVYRLAPGARVADAVAAAGGYGPRVDADAASRLNLAAPLHDGEQVRVPSRDDSPAATPASGVLAGGGGATTGGLLDLNVATAEELDALPGIGPVTAAKIIAAREAAPFTSIDELLSRGVVGEATFRKVQGLVGVGG